MWFVYFCFPGSVPALLASALFPFPALLFTCLPGDLVRLVSLLFPFVSLLVGHCVRLVSLFVSLVVPILVGHCVRLVFLFSFTCASSLPLSLATLHIVSQLLCPAILYICHPALGSGLHVTCNPLHVSPCVYICLPALDCCGRLCLAILCLPALDVASSSRRVFRF